MGLTTWETADLYDKLPNAQPAFKKHDRVKTPIGDIMIVIDPVYSREIHNGEWVPVVRLAFITGKLQPNKKKNHRFFIQHRLKIAP